MAERRSFITAPTALQPTCLFPACEANPGTTMSDVKDFGLPGPFSVLVVEDEPMIAMDIQMMLEQQGLRVLGPVGTVERALGLLERALPDVAVLDLNLRGRLVTPVAERLRNLGVPFIIASADPSVAGSEAVFAGAQGIGKPIQEQHLLAALHHAARLQ